MSKLKENGALLSYYVPTGLGNECMNSKDYPTSSSCGDLEMIFEELLEKSFFSDISYDYAIAPVINSIKISSSFVHNAWHIEDYEIKTLSKEKFRLLLPKNEDTNIQ